MKASRKLLSLPIISLHEGQHLGHVRSLILDASAKSLAALVVDPKGFFKDQRVIPYNKVISVGDDAITIDKGNQVEKVTNIPELLDLLKEKVSIIGTKIVTETGKTIGIAEEYYIDPASGKITSIEVSGGKLEGFLNGKAFLNAEQVKTIGQDVIVTERNSEDQLIISAKGLSDTVRSLLHVKTHKAAGEKKQPLRNYLRKGSKIQPFSEDVLSTEELNATTPQTIDVKQIPPIPSGQLSSVPEDVHDSEAVALSTNEDPSAPEGKPDRSDGNLIS